MTYDDRHPPLYDHTLESAHGNFLYIDDEPSGANGPATLTSLIHHQAYLECKMVFW